MNHVACWFGGQAPTLDRIIVSDIWTVIWFIPRYNPFKKKKIHTT